MRVIRAFAMLVSVAMLGLVGLSTALAAGATSNTTTEHQGTDVITDVVPCGLQGDALYTVTLTYNEVDHFSVGPNSSHFTFTQTGTFVAVPQDSSLPTYTGHFTVWGGGNENAQTSADTDTSALHGTGSDGSTFVFTAVEHTNFTPDGLEHSFSFDNCA